MDEERQETHTGAIPPTHSDYWTPERRRELPYRDIEESGVFEIVPAPRRET